MKLSCAIQATMHQHGLHRGVMADQTPLYLAAKAVNTDNTLVFFFDGAEKEAKCFAENEAVSERLSFPGLGSENYIPVGYTISSFDPDYHKSISAGKVGGHKIN